MRPMLSMFSRNRTAYIIEPYVLPDDPPNRISTDPPEHVSINIIPPASTETCASSNRGWFTPIAPAYKRFTARIVASLGLFTALTWRKKTPERDLESGEVVDVQNKDNICEAIGHSKTAPDVPHAHPSPVVPVRCSGTANVSDVTLVAPGTSLSAARPSRFIQHLPDHPVFARGPANGASIQPSTVEDEPNDRGSITIAPPASTETCLLSNQGWFALIALAHKWFTARVVASLGIFAILTWEKKVPEHDLKSGGVVGAQNKDNPCEAIGHTEIAPDAPRAHPSPVVPVACSDTASVSDITLVAPSMSPGTARPSRFIEHPPDHPVFARAPASDTSIQSSTVDDDPNDRGVFPPLGEQERLRMHEGAAARIKAPALRPLRVSSTVSATVVAPDSRFELQQANPVNLVNSGKPYTRPKRISMQYGIFRPGLGLWLKEWDVRSGRNELTAMGRSALGERRLEVMIPQSPPSSPESSGPVTPTPEFTGTLEMLADGGKGYDLDDLAPAGHDQYKVGRDGAAAL